MTHAEVLTRGIQIHLYSKVCSTHFVEGCFREHCSTLYFLWSRPSQAHLIFSISDAVSRHAPVHPCSWSHNLFWVLLLGVSHQETSTMIFKPKMNCWVFHSVFLSNATSLLFLSTVDNSNSLEEKESLSEVSCTSPPHTFPSLEVNGVGVSRVYRAPRANQISRAVRKKYGLPEGREAQVWVTKEAVLNTTGSSESIIWLVWPTVVCVLGH